VGRVRFGFGRIRSSTFDKKNCQVTRQIRVDLVRVGSDFRSNTIDFFRVSGDFESGRVGFQVLMSLVYFGLRVIRVRVGSDFGLSDIG
jgi:hypothetical protein